jgi:hypothetical protein
LNPIIYSTTSGTEIAEIIDAFRETLAKHDENAVARACITLAIVMYNPDIRLDRLVDAVKQVSEYISLMGGGDLRTQ